MARLDILPISISKIIKTPHQALDFKDTEACLQQCASTLIKVNCTKGRLSCENFITVFYGQIKFELSKLYEI